MAQFNLPCETCAPAWKIMDALKITFTKFKARQGRARSIFFFSTRRRHTRWKECYNSARTILFSIEFEFQISLSYIFLILFPVIVLYENSNVILRERKMAVIWRCDGTIRVIEIILRASTLRRYGMTTRTRTKVLSRIRCSSREGRFRSECTTTFHPSWPPHLSRISIPSTTIKGYPGIDVLISLTLLVVLSFREMQNIREAAARATSCIWRSYFQTLAFKHVIALCNSFTTVMACDESHYNIYTYI